MNPIATPATDSASDASDTSSPVRGRRSARRARFGSNEVVSSTIARPPVVLGTRGGRVERFLETRDHQRVERSPALAVYQLDSLFAHERHAVWSGRRERVVDIGDRHDAG